jgi:hypothetical protein
MREEKSKCTSYFAKYRYKNIGNGVSIALSTPLEMETYSDLFPTWELLNKWKKDHNKEEYIKIYSEKILSKLEPSKVYKDLKDKIILCWEKPGDFCHRHLVADWLMKNLDVQIKEL